MVENGDAGRNPFESRDTNIGVAAGSADRASWGAIFAGTISGAAIYLILGLIGIAAGIGTIDPAEEANPLAGVPYALGIWWTLSALVAFFVGGAIAGRLAGYPTPMTGALHGLTVGSLTLLIISWIATTAIGSTISGAAGAVAQLFTDANRQQIRLTILQPDRQQPTVPRATPPRGGDQDNVGQELRELAPARREVAADQLAEAETDQNYQIARDVQDAVVRAIRREAIALVQRFISPQEREAIREQALATYRDIIRTPGDAGSDLRQFFNFLLSNRGILGEEDLREAKRLLMNRIGLEEEDAEQILQNWSRQYQRTTRELQQLVDQTERQLREALSGEDSPGGLRKPQAPAREDLPTGPSPPNDGKTKPTSETDQRQGYLLPRVQLANDRATSAEAVDKGQSTFADVIESGEQTLDELAIILERLLRRGSRWSAEEAEELRLFLREATDLTEDQTAALVSRWQTRYEQAVGRVEEALLIIRREAIEATDRTLDLLAAVTGWTAFILLVALGSAVVGGVVGRPSTRSDVFLARDVLGQARSLQEEGDGGGAS